jgi:UrcA family protein
MSSVDRHLNVGKQRVVSGLKIAGYALAALALSALAPAAFLTGKEGSAFPAARSARVSLAGLDFATADGAREARERIRKAAQGLCAGNLGQRSLDRCVNAITTAAQQQIEARTIKVSLADLDLSTPEGAHAAGDRLRAAARRVCQGLQPSREVALPRYSACVDEAFAHALRQVDLLQRISLDF